MEFKSIIAITNGNGELEFIAREKARPLVQYYKQDEPYTFLIAVEKWEQSARVFTAFDQDHVRMLCRAIVMTEQSIKIPHLSIDVTDFIEIRKTYFITEDKRMFHAFYKSPSKEESVTNDEYEEEDIYDAVRKHRAAHPERFIEPVGEAQESQIDLWSEMLIEWHKQSTDCVIFNKTINPLNCVMSKFKITRLPKA